MREDSLQPRIVNPVSYKNTNKDTFRQTKTERVDYQIPSWKESVKMLECILGEGGGRERLHERGAMTYMRGTVCKDTG